jgi:hypothetical protein
MKHTPKSTTHWACQKKMEELGGQAPCCACNNHDCSEENKFPLSLHKWLEQ